MDFNNAALLGLGIIFGVYLLYRLMFSKNKIDQDYENMYNKVLTSKEYKVKGQYDK